jgi:hypothetical protein
MRTKVLPIAVVLAVVGSMLLAGAANAGTLIDTTVTIKTQNGDFWGTVDSPRPRLCARNRKVVLFKQLGDVQDPANDERIAMDTASLSGSRYEWNTGNTHIFGKYYARVGRTDSCKADTSKTVRSTRT